MSLERRKPLRAKKGLGRGRKQIKQVSDKRAAENEDRRDALMAVRARCRGWCEVCPILKAAGVKLASLRDHQGDDGHEPLTRARLGSIVDPANILWSCRWSHDWVHAHPLEATALGLLVSS